MAGDSFLLVSSIQAIGEYGGVSISAVLRELQRMLWELWRWIGDHKLLSGGFLVGIWVLARLLSGGRR